MCSGWGSVAVLSLPNCFSYYRTLFHYFTFVSSLYTLTPVHFPTATRSPFVHLLPDFFPCGTFTSPLLYLPPLKHDPTFLVSLDLRCLPFTNMFSTHPCRCCSSCSRTRSSPGLRCGQAHPWRLWPRSAWPTRPTRHRNHWATIHPTLLHLVPPTILLTPHPTLPILLHS